MSKTLKNLTRTGLAAWMLLLSASFTSGTNLHPGHPVDGPVRIAEAMPDEPLCHEVRLRRLHLVRPDLIKYPIAIEVYC